jgi:lipoate-protein ligase A
MKWRLILDSSVNPARNLAVEEAIVRSRKDGTCRNTLRIWRNNNAVVLGCGNDVREEVDLKACKQMGAMVLRRISGGGAVYHDLGNINYSAILNQQAFREKNDVHGLYETFAEVILTGLNSLKIRAKFIQPNNILLNGKKISGMAQHRFYDVILIHGSLLVNSDLQVLSSILRNPKYEVTNLSREVGELKSNEDVEQAIMTGFRKSLHLTFNLEELTPYELRLAHELNAVKYSTENWNLHMKREITPDSVSRLSTVETVSSLVEPRIQSEA